MAIFSQQSQAECKQPQKGGRQLCYILDERQPAQSASPDESQRSAASPPGREVSFQGALPFPGLNFLFKRDRPAPQVLFRPITERHHSLEKWDFNRIYQKRSLSSNNTVLGVLCMFSASEQPFKKSIFISIEDEE